MYTKVYFILAHKKPEQLRELISLLQDGKSCFFLHIDKKANLNTYAEINQMEYCHFIKKRVKCNWGDYSLVQATLEGMKEIKEFMNNNLPNLNYHCILISGEDLPLQSNEKIHNFLEVQQEKSFINHWKLPYDKWWNGGVFRFESLYVFDYKKHSNINRWLNKIIRKLKFHFVLPINRIKKQYPDLEICGGSQWMILSKKLMKFVIETSDENPQFSKFFKYVLAPDELYFPTLIYHFQKEGSFIIENTVTHLAIFEGVDANPNYLSVEEIKNNKTEKTLFARKFDKNINKDSIEYIQNIRK